MLNICNKFHCRDLRRNVLAFTLAEVLITIGIIGIIAAITIPSLITKTNDIEYKSAYKKTFSVINQAFKFVLQDNGGQISAPWATSDTMKDDFKKFLYHKKDCSGGSVQGQCWNNLGGYDKSTGLVIVNSAWWFGTNAALSLNDGISIIFAENSSTFKCTTPGDVSGYGECGRIYIDVNGLKPPNTAGRDIFMLNVYPHQILPWGSPSIYGNPIAANSCTTGSGVDCSTDYLMGN